MFKDIFEDRISILVEAFEGVIVYHIKRLLDLSKFMIRSNGVKTLQDICQHVDEKISRRRMSLSCCFIRISQASISHNMLSVCTRFMNLALEVKMAHTSEQIH